MTANLIKSVDLAKYVVWYSNNKSMPITNLKLQKILYYLQGAHLQKFGHELFEEPIEAWEYGPVVREVYLQYCAYGALNLRSKPEDGLLCDGLRADSKELIGKELDVRLKYTSRELVKQTHSEAPWSNHKKEVENHKKPVITLDEMKDFFCTGD